MHPRRAARLLALLGGLLLATAVALCCAALVGIRLQRDLAAQAVHTRAPVPAIGGYAISADGLSVTFQQQVDPTGPLGWFSMPLTGGALSPASAPVEDLRPFILQSGKLSLRLADGAGVASAPPGTRVLNASLAPDRKTLAYAGQRPGGETGLYLLDDGARLSWLGDFDGLDDLAWSADGQSLGFIALAEGAPQVFSIDRAGQAFRQVTHSPGAKRRPLWSPDGQSIAYLTVSALAPAPTPGAAAPPDAEETAAAWYTLDLIRPDGSAARQLLPGAYPFLPYRWINHGAEIAYPLAQTGQPQVVALYALNLGTGSQRRVYPPYAIEVLTCPTSLPHNGAATLTLRVRNTGLTAAEVPILARSGPRPFGFTGPWNQGSPHSASLSVPAGSSAALTWPVPAAPGLRTYVSALVAPGESYAMAEAHCVIPNTNGVLPNLPFLAPLPPLLLAGMALCLPLLRNEKRRVYWLAWIAAPALVALLVALETWLASY